jgi:predicted dienelactone hydrolase
VLALAAAACASSGSRGAGAPVTTAPRPAPTGPSTHVQLTFEDRSRPAVDPVGTRSAPTRVLVTELYLPGGRGTWPLIEFAHGFNGDPSKFTQLFRAWVDAGFAVLAPRFPITYTDAPTNPIGRAADIAQQPADMRFVLRALLAGEYASRIDAHSIGVAGLSLGGGTTWALISDRCCVEHRYRAAIVMDGSRFGFGPKTYTPTTIPLMVFHIRTDIALPFQAARDAYAQASPPKYFVTIFQGVHPEPYEDTPSTSDAMVQRATIAFWRAYLLGDAKARARIVADATVAGISSGESDLGG